PSTIAAAKSVIEAFERSGTAVALFQPQDDDWPADYEARFWKIYPRRIGKAAAMKALQKIKKSGKVSFIQIMLGVERFARSVQTAEMCFICHPTTWLNGGRWEDEEKALDNSGKKTNNGFAELSRTFAGLR
ncbi:MAG: hypothetical protein WAN65_07010, partial [Candidatus Sulfotelmatobacter sp.]